MRRTRKRLAQISPVALLATIALTPPASAAEAPTPLTSPVRATALAEEIGEERTGGVYYEGDKLIVAVTDQAAAQSVRDAGGTPKLVTRSTAELASIHSELDELGDISNTAWGAEARTNQVVVELFNGVSEGDRAKINEIVADHPDAIRVEKVDSGLRFKATDLRGGNGITSSGWICTAGFNTKNSAGAVYTLTAGHCVPGTGNTWYMDWNGQAIGSQTSYNFGTGTGGKCDGSTRGCDWAAIRANASGINPLGTVRYWGGDYHQIDRSRYPAEGESIDRIGVNSQDKTGNVTKTSVTVNIGGKTMYGMMETNNCALGGDSGGPALNGTTALGLLSGGSDETVCTSSSSGNYRNYFTKVQTVLNERGLRVY
ncbi:S1 family peptidase [Streptomyces albidoflavus]|uniref:S1 family peptidase n=1 Tax=Streptomyces albidoflavus TaxID=1886 RepID=UPI00343AFF71